MKLWTKCMATLLGVVMLGLGGIGLLHTPTGRKLPIGRKILSWMGVQCPLDRSDLTAERVEASRQRGIMALRGNVDAPSRPSLSGLQLDLTSETEARKWAETRGIRCDLMVRGARFLKCADVSPAKLGSTETGQSPVHMLTLAFNPAGKLVAVDLFRRKLESDEASLLIRIKSAMLQEKLGRPTDTAGETSSAGLSGTSMKTAYIHYLYHDYVAMLTATRIPWSGGIAVHEQYSSDK